MSLFPTVLSFPLPPLLSHAPLAVHCVLALTRASTRYTKKRILISYGNANNNNNNEHVILALAPSTSVLCERQVNAEAVQKVGMQQGCEGQ